MAVITLAYRPPIWVPVDVPVLTKSWCRWPTPVCRRLPPRLPIPPACQATFSLELVLKESGSFGAFWELPTWRSYWGTITSVAAGGATCLAWTR